MILKQYFEVPENIYVRAMHINDCFFLFQIHCANFVKLLQLSCTQVYLRLTVLSENNQKSLYLRNSLALFNILIANFVNICLWCFYTN